MSTILEEQLAPVAVDMDGDLDFHLDSESDDEQEEQVRPRCHGC